MDFDPPLYLGHFDLGDAVDRFKALEAKREQFGQSVEDDAERQELAQRLLPVIEQFGQFAEAITSAMHLAYDEAGQPFGAGDEALWRWAQNQAETGRSRLDAEADAAWQRSVEQLNQGQLEQRRN